MKTTTPVVIAPAEFTISAAVVGGLLKADKAAADTKRLGLSNLIALVAEVYPQARRVKHGAAADLAAVLKDSGLGAPRAKYYSEKCMTIVKAIQHTVVLARAKAFINEEDAAANEAAAAALATLASLASVAEALKWGRENGPKKDKAAAAPEAAAAPAAPAAAPTAAPAADIFAGAQSVFTALALWAAGMSQAAPAVKAKAKGRASLVNAA